MTLPTWAPWFFLIGGVLASALSFLIRRKKSGARGFFLGVLGILVAFYLWFGQGIILK
jgi:LPXTG-motif cell wall-anchored protein